LGHALKKYSAKAATCTEKGWNAYEECTRCDYTTYKELPAKGHTVVVDKVVTATCEKNGLTEGSHCSVCQTVLKKQEVVSATGHKYGVWTQIKVPTYTEMGEERRDCMNCDVHEVRNVAKLEAPELVITNQPQDISAPLKETVQMTVEANGYELSYQWQIKTGPNKKWINSTLDSGKTEALDVTVTKGRDGYQYRCIITDGMVNTITSDIATLTVKQINELKITAQPDDVKAKLGTTVKMTVEAKGDGLKYQWQIKTGSNKKWINSTIASGKTNSLEVNATNGRNGYQYRCIITDTYGNTITSETAKLTVTKATDTKLKITNQPDDVKAKLGTTVKMTVEAKGDGLKYQWQIKTGSNKKWIDSTIASGKTNSLEVSVTKGRNGYQYRCIITDENGNTVTSDTAKLTVNTTTTKLKITTQPKNTTAKVGEKIQLTVKANGDGLKYQWQIKTGSNKSWINSTIVSGKTNSLDVDATRGRNGYQYRCKITDAYGNVEYSKTVKLTVK
ncbi:MAG: hypothetical protein II983_02665, partial [Firmicutes bacterium]|nr:hypothetical protein [Bacillota bacterium]